MFHPAKIIRQVRASPTVVVLDLKLVATTNTSITSSSSSSSSSPPTMPLTFQPGQWIDFMVPPNTWVGGFSPCSSPRDLPLIRIAVKRSDHAPAAWVHDQFDKQLQQQQQQQQQNDQVDESNTTTTTTTTTPQQSSRSEHHPEVKIRFGGNCTLVPLIPPPSSPSTQDANTEIMTMSEMMMMMTTTTLRPAVFCAGGIGISPILSQYREYLYQRTKLVQQAEVAATTKTSNSSSSSSSSSSTNMVTTILQGTKTRFLYSVSTQDELVFGDELCELSSSPMTTGDQQHQQHCDDQMIFSLTKSQQWDEDNVNNHIGNNRIGDNNNHSNNNNNNHRYHSGDDDHVTRYTGTRMMIPFLDESPLDAIYYICGPPSMIDDAVSYLQQNKGIPKEHIKYEKWW